MKDVNDLKVMDMACGDGFFARFLKKHYENNIKLIVGVDISDEMISLANSIETQNPQGIDYIRSDVSLLPYHPNPDYASNYDLVVASYFLNYAQNKTMLLDFCTTIYNCLKPNGKFITLNINVSKDPRKLYNGHERYGLSSTFCSKLVDDNYKDVMETGHRVEINRFVPSDPSTCAVFDNHYLSRATYEECFKTAGFSKWEWKPLLVDPIGLTDDTFPAGFWDTLSNPIEAGSVCIVLSK
ncbi:S-adenosyl-L-methionine-dependent methyltransferase [Conidiobolus coronatus NRRL 28638]|uniref:S-adenosyl-L-methionine-dependent methyltransferase n=1 Tax=Conidiobolus coronatus (strain ATCC 28846 / CBS 209.66 / NRRL 28638) TaxID=796925 RepID=A0A137NPC5_CONC2|nr:S-adenosyl-L-methionine-dependent methyltransferase [Conidiobolus coronatus NRRL 28638]|eukprot:KXN64582.1 S-adenosyl-L-methionine-dependent methyltransferase [Conidiobolus coronatus NRRL 28638]